MKKLLAILTALLVMPMAFAIDIGGGIDIDFGTEQFIPRIWMCDHRVVIDDDIEPGRVDGDYICSQKDEFVDFDEDVCDSECCTKRKQVCDRSVTGTNNCNDAAGQEQSNANCERDPNLDGCSDGPICAKWTGCYLKGDELIERHNNYAFEGEKIEWKVLVMDKNKIEQIKEVVATIGGTQAEDCGIDPFTGLPKCTIVPSNTIEVECLELQGYGEEVGILDSCNARIDQEEITTFDNQIMAYYECTFTVEPAVCDEQTQTCSAGMYGESWVGVEAVDTSGVSAAMDENEFWFFNPVIGITVGPAQAKLNFGTVRPGTIAYSNTITVGNGAQVGSGVTLDMFISGTDFYDDTTGGSGARCSLMNRLKLGNNYVAVGDASNNNMCQIGFTDTDDHFCYFATNGAYSTQADPRSDAEGYAPIVYGGAFTRDFYNDAEMIQANAMPPYWGANMLVPGAEMSLTFKLGLPVPCVGNFKNGDINFWAEAI